MYEFLKPLFGKQAEGEAPKALTYAELVAAIEANKTLKLADLSAGEYVSKHKYDDQTTELAGVRKQLDDANAQIKAFDGLDVEGIKKQVSDWKTKYDTDTKALNDQLNKQARDYAENLFLSGYKFTSKAARNGVADEFRKKGFKLEDGVFVGAKEFMDGLMKDADYSGAFATEKKQEQQPNPAEGAQPFMPRFSAPSDAGNKPGANPFNFALNHVREPKQN